MGKIVGWIVALAVIAAAAFGVWKYVLPSMQGGSGADGTAGVELAQFTDLKSEAFVLDGASELDLAALESLAPDGWAIKTGTTSFDAATGATSITDLRFENATNPELGVTAKTVRVWGGDIAALGARLRGERMSETLPIAARIDAEDISLTGLETLMDDVMDSYTDVIVDAMPEDEDLSAAMAFSLDDYSVSMGRMIATDVKLRPYEIIKKPAPEAWKQRGPVITLDENGEMIEAPAPDASDSMDELFGFLQEYAAVSRTLEASKIAFFDTSYSFDMTQTGLKQKMSASMPVFAYSGLRGGDVDLLVANDISFEMEMDIIEGGELDTEAAGAFDAMFSGPMTGKIDLYKITDMRLDKALRYLSIGEMPPRTETDLMSLGTFIMDGTEYNLNGKPFYSIGRFTMSGEGFYWLAPTDISVEIDDLSYNIGEILGLVSSIEEMGSEEAEMMTQVRGVMETYGLDKPRIDLKGSWKANAETGRADMRFATGLEDYYQDAYIIDITVPEAEAMIDFVLDDTINGEDREEAFEAFFEDRFIFHSASYKLEDEGGLEKIFGLVIDVAKLNPEGEMAMFAQMEPDGLRNMAASMVGMASFEAAKEFPPAQGYFEAFMEFIKVGGSFEIMLDPPAPITPALAEEYPDPEPEKIVELLGLTVEHSK